jgi:mono/diheme cytochrome c family protein
MPRVPMPPDRVDVIARLITHAEPSAPVAEEDDEGRPAGLLPPVVGAEPGSGALYIRHCAMCHGADGRGDGFNAPNLRTRPAVHASAEDMSRRTDDRLFDGIHAGAYVLNGSPEMPPFGEVLSDAQIRGLVAHIRQLCRCAAPTWSRDGVRGAGGGAP